MRQGDRREGFCQRAAEIAEPDPKLPPPAAAPGRCQICV